MKSTEKWWFLFRDISGFAASEDKSTMNFIPMKSTIFCWFLGDGDTMKLRQQLRAEHDAEVQQISLAAEAREISGFRWNDGEMFMECCYDDIMERDDGLWWIMMVNWLVV